MSTAKTGVIAGAMDSKPVMAAKDAMGKAAAAVADVFMDPPLAPSDSVRTAPKPMRRAAKKLPSKKTAAKKSMDRKLVSMEDYEVKYLAQKHGVTQKAVKAAVSKVGSSRNKVEAEIKKGK